jgi:hypothetical protein
MSYLSLTNGCLYSLQLGNELLFSLPPLHWMDGWMDVWLFNGCTHLRVLLTVYSMSGMYSMYCMSVCIDLRPMI